MAWERATPERALSPGRFRIGPDRDGKGTPQGRSLEQLATHLAIEHGVLHRALEDSRLTVAVFHRLLDKADALSVAALSPRDQLFLDHLTQIARG